MARAHRDYLSGRPGSLIVPPDEAISRVRAYFADRRLGGEFAEVAVHALRVGAVCARLLTGHVRYDDPTVAAAAADVARSSAVHSLWLFGSWAFVALVEGDAAMARRLVGEVIGHVASLDPTTAYLSAPALLATEALLESDATTSADDQRAIAARLEPLAATLRQLRWDLELVPVLLALRTAHRRAGDFAVADALTAEVDVVLALCDGTVVYDRARAVLTAHDASVPADDTATSDDTATLTARERDVLEQLDRGLTYGEIACALGLSVNTVRSHLSAIYRKLGVRTRYGAVERWRASPSVTATTCARLDTPSLR
jgi:DNA-binding CsgD family transcriptional regulator